MPRVWFKNRPKCFEPFHCFASYPPANRQIPPAVSGNSPPHSSHLNGTILGLAIPSFPYSTRTGCAVKGLEKTPDPFSAFRVEEKLILPPSQMLSPGGRLNVWCAVDCACGGPGTMLTQDCQMWT